MNDLEPVRRTVIPQGGVMRDPELVFSISEAGRVARAIHITRKSSAGVWPVLVLLVLAASIPLRAAAAARGVGGAPTSSLVEKDASETFPVTPVGQTSTLCNGFCFCSGSCPAGGCDATGSGTVTLDHDPSLPFAAYGYVIQPYGSNECGGGTPVQLPAFVDVGQQLAFTFSFSPESPGTFNDYLTLNAFNFYLSGSTPSGAPNLVPYQPSGWSDSLVVSNTPGTQVDSATLTSSDTLYASWAVENNGDLPTSVTFYTDLYLDGSYLTRWQSPPPVNPGDYRFIKDHAFGPLPAGTHTLELVPDETATAGPSDNYTKTFTIASSGAPNLVPYHPPGWSAPLVVSTTTGTQVDSTTLTSADTLYASWAVLNNGSAATSIPFYTQLLLDNAVVQTWEYTPALEANNYIYLKDYKVGSFTSGTHTLQLLPDITNTVGPSNTYTKTLTIAPASSGLPPQPTPTTSWYVYAYSTKSGLRSLYSWAKGAGAQAGRRNEASTSQNADFIILDFGSPRIMNGAMGTNGLTCFMDIAAITNAVKQFILGYESTTQLTLFLAVGLTNQFQPMKPTKGCAATGVPDSMTAAHGQIWAQMLIDLDTWIATNNYQISLASALDLELDYAKKGPTLDWYKGFIAVDAGSIAQYDFGDANYCRVTCDNGWTPKDIVALPTLFAPEIYGRHFWRDWQKVSLYEAQSGGVPLAIEAILSEHGACTTNPPCENADYTAQDAWTALVNSLNSNPLTIPVLSELTWSTDISWRP
jgi:hypothetical protein